MHIRMGGNSNSQTNTMTKLAAIVGSALFGVSSLMAQQLELISLALSLILLESAFGGILSVMISKLLHQSQWSGWPLTTTI